MNKPLYTGLILSYTYPDFTLPEERRIVTWGHLVEEIIGGEHWVVYWEDEDDEEDYQGNQWRTALLLDHIETGIIKTFPTFQLLL